jgi:hypothetical protein
MTGPSGAAAGGSRDKGEAEQVLLDKAITQHPDVFTHTGYGSWTGTSPASPAFGRSSAPAPTC